MALVEFYWCFVSKSGRLQVGLICWKLTFSSFKYSRFYFIFIFTLFPMLTAKLNYKWKYIFVYISRSTNFCTSFSTNPTCFCISWRVWEAEWMVILFRGFHFFEYYYHRTTKQQSERLYFIFSLFLGVKKNKKGLKLVIRPLI